MENNNPTKLIFLDKMLELFWSDKIHSTYKLKILNKLLFTMNYQHPSQKHDQQTKINFIF